MTFSNSTRSAFRFSPVLLVGLAVLMVSSVHTYAACGPAQCETDGVCCLNCLPEYACVHTGASQGPGSQCFGEEACCMPDGSCQTGVDGTCCDEAGGTSGGPGKLPAAPPKRAAKKTVVPTWLLHAVTEFPQALGRVVRTLTAPFLTGAATPTMPIQAISSARITPSIPV